MTVTKENGIVVLRGADVQAFLQKTKQNPLTKKDVKQASREAARRLRKDGCAV